MNPDDFLNSAMNSYNQEYQRFQNIDSKAFSVLGLIGVMISIFSFLSINNIINTIFMPIILLGISILFSAIIILLNVVFPKQKIPAIKSKKYYEKLIKNQKVANLTKSYVQLATRFEYRNNRKVKNLRCGIIVMSIGLGISFIGVILTLS